MAQGLFADLLRGRRDIEVTSAGIGAVGGQLPSSHAVEVMSELGIDIRNIRSKPLMVDLVRKADFILMLSSIRCAFGLNLHVLNLHFGIGLKLPLRSILVQSRILRL